MSSTWLPLALAETTILFLNLGCSRGHFNWRIGAAFASTTFLGNNIMLFMTSKEAYTYDFISTLARLLATFYIFMPLLGLCTLRPTRRLRVRFPVSVSTLEVL